MPDRYALLALILSGIIACLTFCFLHKFPGFKTSRSHWIAGIVFGIFHAATALFLAIMSFILAFWACLSSAMGGNGTQGALEIARYIFLTFLFIFTLISLYRLVWFTGLFSDLKPDKWWAPIPVTLLIIICDNLLILLVLPPNQPAVNQHSSHCGFIDHAGKFVLPPKYALAADFCEGLAMVVTDEQQDHLHVILGEKHFSRQIPGYDMKPLECSFIDKSGNSAITDVMTTANHFSDGLCPRFESTKKLFGYMDKTGKMVLDAKFITANSFDSGLATVELSPESSTGSGDFKTTTNNASWAVINKKGQILSRLHDAVRVTSFSNGYAKVFSPGADQNDPLVARVINTTGKFVDNGNLKNMDPSMFELAAGDHVEDIVSVPIDYGDYFQLPFSEELSLVKQKEGGGFSRANGFGGIRSGTDWSFVDKKNSFIFGKFLFPEARSFKEGISAVSVSCKNGPRWMFMSKAGKWIGKPTFATANSFSEGLASVSIYTREYDPKDVSANVRFGFVDRTGSWAVVPKFLYARSFSEGLASVETSK